MNVLSWLVAVLAPYAALAVFLAGLVWRVLLWARSPVPFRIPTTGGQQKSLPWIKAAWLESPSSALGVTARMALEVLLFRSLFRGTRVEWDRPPGLSRHNKEGKAGALPHLVHGEEKWLWLGALAFHWSFLIIFLRHLRFFLEPVPPFVLALQNLDGFFQVGAPVVFATDAVILAALTFLLMRRLLDPQIRYISLPADYLALGLLLGIAVTGVWMRYFTKVNIPPIKQFALGLVTFSPVVPEGMGLLFYLHLLLVSALAAWFPFSKLMHMGGVFLSPTRNLANNNRAVRHINPWNYPVKVHTYQEWEEEFHDKIKAAGLPLWDKPSGLSGEQG